MNKKRGCDAERELLHLLGQKNFSVARVAGSGMISETNCDLLVSNGKKKYAIEVKISSNNKKYLDKKQIKDLIIFSKNFGFKPLLAIKFLRKGWWFIEPKNLGETKKGYVISLEKIRLKNVSLFKK